MPLILDPGSALRGTGGTLFVYVCDMHEELWSGAAGQEASVSRGEPGGTVLYASVCICAHVFVSVSEPSVFPFPPVSGRPGRGPPSSAAQTETPCSFLWHTHSHSKDTHKQYKQHKQNKRRYWQTRICTH